MKDVLYRRLCNTALPCRIHKPVLVDHGKLDRESGKEMDQGQSHGNSYRFSLSPSINFSEAQSSSFTARQQRHQPLQGNRTRVMSPDVRRGRSQPRSDFPKSTKIKITDERDDTIQLQKRIRFVKKYDFMKTEIDEDLGKNLAKELFSNDADILSNIESAVRRREKIEILLKKILDNIDEEFDNFLRALKENPRLVFIAEELESFNVNDKDLEAYLTQVEGQTPKNLLKFSANDNVTLEGELEQINSKPGKLEMIIDKFFSSLIFNQNQHTNILQDSWPMKRFLDTLQDSIHTDNLDEFNRILTTAGSLTAISSLDINKNLLKRKREPDADDESEHRQHQKRHKVRKLDKTVERAVIRSWKSSLNLATNAFDEELDFCVDDVIQGSIVIQLRPTSSSSWDKLKESCKTARIKDLVAKLFINEDVFLKIPEGEFNLPLKIYTVHKDCGEKKALFVLENVDKMGTLFDRYRDIFKEELDIDEELLTYLVKANLIDANLSTRIASMQRRSQKMETLFNEIHKHGKKTYDTLIKYAKHKKEALYKMLMTEQSLDKAEYDLLEMETSCSEKMGRRTEEHKKELFFECTVELHVLRHERQTRQHGVGVEITCPRIYDSKCYFEWKGDEPFIPSNADLTKTWEYVDQPIESEEEVLNKRKLKQGEGEVKGKRAHTDRKPRS